MAVSQMIIEGLKYMGIGVGIVFAVLGLFYFVIKALLKFWPSKDEN